ncbi:hypothetical protein H7097_02955 [Aeromicrobium sp.]|nr:hypothetical protein [Candidatus Saccharibacteria bacterium]
MNKQILSVDIDDVLSHSAKQIMAYGNENWGHTHSIEDFNEDLASMWQVEPDEAERRWLEYIDSGIFSRLEVIVEAREALERLSQTYQIIAVTSRRDSLLPLTGEWIASNYPGIFHQIIGAGIYGNGRPDAHMLTKADVLKSIGSTHHIDDQIKHCAGAYSVGVPAILFGDYPWNRDVDLPETVTRCKDWPAVLEYFDGIV